MEAGGDEEVADGQNVQSSNADVGPSDSRDERSKGTCFFYILSFKMSFIFLFSFLTLFIIFC